MTRLFIYLILFGVILYLFSAWGKPAPAKPKKISDKPSRWPFRTKKDPREMWVQVYETATVSEARMIQARLQESEIECILYEQGKKDIHGNSLKGVGVAVPKSAISQAQNIISRMPV